MNFEEKVLQLLAQQGEMIGQINGRLDVMDGRLDRLEATQGEMRETLTRVAVTQEGVVLPNIQTLAEGHSELRREIGTLATKEQVEELASEVSVIKDVVSGHSRDIGRLKKAQ